MSFTRLLPLLSIDVIMLFWIFVLILVVYFFKSWYDNTKIVKDFPHGPIGLPVVGYPGLFSAKNILEAFSSLEKRYGKVFSVNLGPSPRSIVISDYELLKEAFENPLLTARPQMVLWFNKYFRYGNGYDSRGLIFSQGEEWQDQRRFALRNLRDFGFGKASMESMIMDEIRDLTEIMDSEATNSEGVLIRNKFNISIVNALWKIITGRRYNVTDPQLMKVVASIDKLASDGDVAQPFQAIPWLRHVIPEWSGWNDAVRVLETVTGFIKPILREHVERHDPEQEPEDYMDIYLKKVSETKDSRSSFHGERGVQSLEASLLDLLIAGSDTTSLALSFSVLYMIHFQDIQRKAQAEVDRVVGKDRAVSLADRQNLPYVEAVMEETLRLGCIAPLGIVHAPSEDVVIKGHLFTKGTAIFPNYLAIMNDPEHFPDPKTFKPERYLGPDGKFKHSDVNITFGIGKRNCLGRTLAMNEFFLFFSSFLQRYTFEAVDPSNPPTLEPKVGFTRSPQPFKTKIVRRT